MRFRLKTPKVQQRGADCTFGSGNLFIAQDEWKTPDATFSGGKDATREEQTKGFVL